MHEALLCRTPLASVPYVLESAGLRVYSLEELCHYIICNTSLVDADFCTPELCRWIREEAGRPQIGDKLLTMLSEHAATHLIVGTLLAQSGYVTAPQLRGVMTALASYEKQTPGERRKVAADRLLDTGRYQAAVTAYRRMLDEPDSCGFSPALWADVWNNLGTAYARLFFFRDAAECFAQSFRRSRKDSAARSMICACLMAGDRRLMRTQAEKYEIPETVCVQTAAAVEKLRASSAVTDQNEKVRAALAKDPSSIRSIVEEQMEAYRGQVR